MRTRITYLLVFLFALITSFSYGQTKTSVRGTITDSATNSPLPFANISFEGTTTGASSDTAGNFFIQTNIPVAHLVVTYLGYKTKIVKVLPDRAQVIKIALPQQANELKVTIIKPKKSTYHNKGNPAVELMRKVIDRKVQNMSVNYDYFECKKYTKMVIGISDVPDKMMNRRSLRKVKFFMKNTDTTVIVGKKILPIYMNELISDYYTRKTPNAVKEIVTANKKTIIANYIDDVGFIHFLNYMFKDVDIYDENISLFTNKFMSPVAVLAPSFYYYFIVDTIVEEGQKCARVQFIPRNTKDLLFQGYLYIALDSSYAVKKVDMTVNKGINLNWVHNFRLVEDYAKQQDNRWMVSKDNLYGDFKLTKGAKSGMYAEKSVAFGFPAINKSHPDDFYKGDAYNIVEDSIDRGLQYWQDHRLEELSPSESKIYANMDSLRRVGPYKRDIDIVGIILVGYQDLGILDLGPLYSTYSHNGVEGGRFRIGGATTPKFSNKIQLSGYGAYGLGDNIYKCNGTITYSLTNHNIYHFPVKSLTASYSYDTHVPGEDIAYLQPDNVLFSVKRGLDDKIFYEKIFSGGFLDEFPNHFSFNISYANNTTTPGGALQFQQNTEAGLQTIPNIQTSSFTLLLRYAHREKTYQKKWVRVPVTTFPTYTLQFTQGIKGFAGGQYNYENLIGTFSGRLNLAPLGYSDIIMEGGMLFGQVPYPLLFIHRANQTYLYDEHSYTMMNFLEFASDKYVAFTIDHCFYGFFFNRIPLLRKLNWREGLSFKILYGGLSTQNNPANNSNVFVFPAYSNGVPITYTLGQLPYMEASFDICNVFKILRLDLVRRITYLNNPDVSPWGFRAKLKIDF